MNISPMFPDETVLIVVPTLNEAAHIRAVIANLLCDAPPATRLVVVDGGSTDATCAIVRQITDPRVRLLHNPQRIQSAAVNLAVQREGEGATYLLRADAHSHYPSGFLRSLLDDIRATRATAVTVAMNTVGGEGFSEGVAAAQNSRLGTGGAAHRAGRGGRFIDHGHHALIRMDAFRAIGGYDATQSHNEDAEFDHRLRANGGRIWLSARTEIGYYPRQTAAALFRQYLKFGAGRAETLIKHRLMPRLRQMVPVCIPPALLAAVAAVPLVLAFSGVWALLLVPALVWAAACLGCGAVLAVRAGRPNVLWSGPAAMLMHLGWGTGFLWKVLTWPASPKKAGGSLSRS
jgi:succinoglycan biosynthesis protein ExoA